MPLEMLKYLENEQEHKNFADTLGQLQGMILAGTYSRTSGHAYYAGHEMKAKGAAWGRGDYHLKMDCPGKGKGNGRSQNRVIVRMSSADTLFEDWAAVWRHDSRIQQLGAGFLKRAETMKDYFA